MGFPAPPSGGGGGAVSSVFTRAGNVVASVGDYTAAQVTNAADKASAAAQAFTGVLRPALAAAATDAPALSQISARFTILNGALPSLQLASAVAAQVLTSRDAELLTPVTFNPGVSTLATCLLELSADNVTYSVVGTETVPLGVAGSGTIRLVGVHVPAGWYVRMTVTNAVLGLSILY